MLKASAKSLMFRLDLPHFRSGTRRCSGNVKGAFVFALKNTQGMLQLPVVSKQQLKFTDCYPHFTDKETKAQNVSV